MDALPAWWESASYRALFVAPLSCRVWAVGRQGRLALFSVGDTRALIGQSEVVVYQRLRDYRLLVAWRTAKVKDLGCLYSDKGYLRRSEPLSYTGEAEKSWLEGQYTNLALKVPHRCI